MRKEKTGVDYIHLHSYALHWEVFAGPAIRTTALVNSLRSRQDDNDYRHGGITFRIDHDRQTIVTSICSMKDFYSRRRGRELTDERAEVLNPAPFSVLVPKLDYSERSRSSIVAGLQKLAMKESFKIWLNLGWPADQFSVNFITDKPY